MNLNNFVVIPSKPKSMKLNVRNLRELRMEKLQLDQQTKDMESKLEELRERMSQEKEEREKTGAFRWRSAQPRVLGAGLHNAKTNKENATQRISPGKMKIKVLKDEPLPVAQKQVVAQPAIRTQDPNRRLRLKGKVCGQCEVQLAGLMCSECGEDYCVGCFVRFHQKGALQRHRMIPIQAQLQTPVTARDVLDRVQQQVPQQQNPLTHGTESADERETPGTEKMPVFDVKTQQKQMLLLNDGADVDDEEGGEEDDSSLLKGYFDEEESSRSFQEALKEWREKGRTGDAFRPTPSRPVSATETQTEKRPQKSFHLDFKEDTLSYMEKLLLKRSRRGQIEEFLQQANARHRPDPTTPKPAETDEVSDKLTEEQMELRKYFASLFPIAHTEDVGKMNIPAESCLSIVELNEMDTDATFGSFEVEEENESEMLASGKKQDLSPKSTFGCSQISNSTPSHMTKGSILSSSSGIGPPSQETNISLPKSEGSPLPQMRLKESQHSAVTEKSSESFPREDQNAECSSQVMLTNTLSDSPKPESLTRSSPTQQMKSSDLVPPLFSLSPRKKLNPDCDDDVVSSSGRHPSVISTQQPSSALLTPKQSPKSPDYHFSTKLVSPPVNMVNHRLEHSISHSETPSESVIASLKISPRKASTVLSIHDSPIDEKNSPPPSRWLKGARRSPETTMHSLHLSISDSEDEMTGEDVCLLPSEEDSSDEELKCINDSEVMKNITSSSSDSIFTLRRLSENENKESGLLTKSSQALRSLAQRQDVQPGQNQDLEGFFTLGLKTEDLQISSTPDQTPRERHNSTEYSLAIVQDFWRPSSSLRQNAEEGLVNVLVNSQPIRNPPISITPRLDTPSVQIQSFSSHQDALSRCSSRCSSHIQSFSTHQDYSSSRPLSRAAHEIMEVQSVEQPEPNNSDEEEQDYLTLACLEEEFRNMSCTPLGQGQVQ